MVAKWAPGGMESLWHDVFTSFSEYILTINAEALAVWHNLANTIWEVSVLYLRFTIVDLVFFKQNIFWKLKLVFW